MTHIKLTFFKTLQKPEGPDDAGATATIEIDTDLDKDAQAIFERKKQVNEVLC